MATSKRRILSWITWRIVAVATVVGVSLTACGSHEQFSAELTGVDVQQMEVLSESSRRENDVKFTVRVWGSPLDEAPAFSGESGDLRAYGEMVAGSTQDPEAYWWVLAKETTEKPEENWRLRLSARHDRGDRESAELAEALESGCTFRVRVVVWDGQDTVAASDWFDVTRELRAVADQLEWQ